MHLILQKALGKYVGRRITFSENQKKRVNNIFVCDLGDHTVKNGPFSNEAMYREILLVMQVIQLILYVWTFIRRMH